MRVSLWIRETAANGKRRYVKPNREEDLPGRYSLLPALRCRGQASVGTLGVNSLTSALAARATKEAALLSATPAVASAPAKRINVNDAIATYAIKTIGKIPQTTSNIWAKDPAGTVDYFVIPVLDHEDLKPICVLKISSRNAANFLKRDMYSKYMETSGQQIVPHASQSPARQCACVMSKHCHGRHPSKARSGR